ncbi:MAG: calcium/sodium antiporter [archaeon]
MLALIIWIFIFISCLFILFKSSNYFINSAENIGKFLKLPPFIIGVVIVGIGTSLPELVSSIFAVIKGSSSIVPGIVIGSNITNIFLVFGLSAILVKTTKIDYEIIDDLPILAAASFLLMLTISDGVFNLFDAILCLTFLVIHLVYILKKDIKYSQFKKEEKELFKSKLEIRHLIILIISSCLIYFSAQYLIESVIKISTILNIGRDLIAVTILSLGTSLPELFVTIVAAIKKKPEIAVGNIMGSNIFNSLAVMGIPALFGSIIVPTSVITFALPIMLIATFLFFFVVFDKKITRMHGLLLILFYIFFIVKSFGIM